jgi:hypothetical protein
MTLAFRANYPNVTQSTQYSLATLNLNDNKFSLNIV